MAAKTSPSILRRFKGAHGSEQLAVAICLQPAVGGDLAIASEIIAAGTLMDVRTGKIIIQQGDSDNDIYFIASGAVSITINAREIATQRAGQHVGEMALLDTMARRSANVATTDRAILLRVAEPDITSIASRQVQSVG